MYSSAEILWYRPVLINGVHILYKKKILSDVNLRSYFKNIVIYCHPFFLFQSTMYGDDEDDDEDDDYYDDDEYDLSTARWKWKYINCATLVVRSSEVLDNSNRIIFIVLFISTFIFIKITKSLQFLDCK